MLELYNKLNTVQSVRIKDRDGSHYDMFIESKRSVTIENYQLTRDILDKIDQGSIVEVSGLLSFNQSPVIKEPKVEETKVEETKVEETAGEEETTVGETTVEETAGEAVIADEPTVEEATSDKDVFVCEICGNEYASQRGLDMHKSKAHK